MAGRQAAGASPGNSRCSEPGRHVAVVDLKKKHLAQMIAHARDEAPLEACGILAGKQDRVVEVYRARNADCSPISYRLDPEEQYRIFLDIEDKGLDILGIYHSHPTSPAVPSNADLKQAYYPEATYFVVSLADPAEAQVRAFRIADGEVTEEEMVVV